MYYLYVAIFGAFGAVTRYWISSALSSEVFPYNTLLINIVGCFFLAVVVKYLTTLPNLSKNFVNGIGTGFIGSFTTFSTFSTEVSLMIVRGDIFPAACYIFASIMGGFLSAALGFYLSSHMVRRKELKENGG
jgi:fluoride exporter